MANSFLLFSSSIKILENQIEKLLSEREVNKNHPDVLFFDEEQKMGITQAKQVKDYLSLKPYQAKGRVVIIMRADTLTPDAQNALLKILEEPPLSSTIILGSTQEQALLDTVKSRCQIIYLEDGELPSSETVLKLLSLTLPQRFEFIEKLEKKDELILDLLLYYRHSLHKNPSQQTTSKIIKTLLEAERWSKANVSERAILEYLMLKLPDNS